jgi:elongation factor Ts
MTIDKSLLQQIRKETGARITDCQKALIECQGDLDQAKEWLRKKGIAAGAKKTDRATHDGAVALCADGANGVLIEINCETDFVAKNVEFLSFADKISHLALTHNASSLDGLTALSVDGTSVEDMRLALAGKTGENIRLQNLVSLSTSPGIVASYVHGAFSPSVGKIGIMVALESTGNADELAAIGKKIAMHVAATSPDYVSIGDVPQDVIDKEKSVLSAQIAEQKKDAPEDIRIKMIDGRMGKLFGQIVLEEQDFVMEPGTKVKDMLAKASDQLGAPIRIMSFCKMTVGTSTVAHRSQ